MLINLTKNKKNRNVDNYIILNKLINFYIIFIFYFGVQFLLINSFSYFNKVFINLNFFSYFNLSNSKKQHLFNYIMLKKQNSIMKKKYNLYNNLFPLYFKKKLKKSIFKNWNYNVYNYENHNMSKFINVLNGKKKLKKSILLNRLFYNYLNYKIFKTSKKLTNNINKYSKLFLNIILFNVEYGLKYILINTDLVKSFNDINKFVKLSYLYLNRKLVTSNDIILFQGDIIEFNINYKFYNYIFKFKNFNNKYIYKLRTKLWFKIKNYNKIKVNYNDSKISNVLLKNNLLFKKTIPSYLEIDYLTLSIIILYKTLNYKEYNYTIKKLLVIYMFKLYNWK